MGEEQRGDERKQANIRVNEDHWDALGDMANNRSAVVREFMKHYVETGDMDDAVVMTRKSVMRTRLSTIRKEMESLNHQAEEIEEYLREEEEGGGSKAIRVDLGSL